ncbi:hypothetical protein UFOVP80_36 [uncultured Caudovirales phage]|jgi:hypothetical protein|uniref:Uncharacterized protein n=1 Tax=uncultured Caudovirales phage TaxID=2100421 RepID=A0A6J5L011_9CAUD|nr:hypothetical protein UFOVP80_36 [uncultured Caudovirales phage]
MKLRDGGFAIAFLIVLGMVTALLISKKIDPKQKHYIPPKEHSEDEDQ